VLSSERGDDVLKAERRFANHMLFANSTKIREAFSGAGIAKRFCNDGKRN